MSIRRAALWGAGVPFVLAAVLLVAVTLAALLSPDSVRGPVVLAVGSAILLGAFLRAPKPTLLVFALFVLLYDTLARWLTPGVRQIDEVVIPGFVLIAAWRVQPWRRDLIRPVRDGAVVALVLLAVASSLVNGVPLAVWLPGLLLTIKVIAFLYVVHWHEYGAADIRQFAPLVLGLAALLLGLGFIELFDPVAFRETLNLTSFSETRGQLPSIKSLFWHPVVFSWFAAFVGLFLFAYYLVYRRWWLLIGALVFTVGVILSGRRRAIAGMGLGLLGALLAQLRARSGSRPPVLRRWLPLGIGVALVVLVFLPGLLGLLRMTVLETSEPGANGPQLDAGNPRVALYLTSVAIARDFFPFGAGLGRYGSGTSRVEYSPIYERYGLDEIVGLSPERSAYITDTFWPRILGEIGVFGLAAYLVFVGAVALSLWRAAHRTWPDPYVAAFCIAAWMIFLQAIVETLASSMFNSPSRVYLVFGAVGVALAMLRAAERTPSPAVEDGTR